MKFSNWLAALAALPLLMASTCGEDGTPSYVSPFCLSHPGHTCGVDSDCSDNVFCDGVERCMPGAAGADGCGCIAANPATACLATQTCNEAEQRCEQCRTDADGDGHISMECGGDDCDDNDPDRFPGNTEVCDDANHDEDCDPTTYGERDMDGDQFFDAKCCNIDGAGTHYCGTDCDDTNAAIVPGAQICFKDGSTNVLICQSDGTWSSSVACGGVLTCTAQPNGLGVCH
jgi:hypothetical protein